MFDFHFVAVFIAILLMLSVAPFHSVSFHCHHIAHCFCTHRSLSRCLLLSLSLSVSWSLCIFCSFHISVASSHYLFGMVSLMLYSCKFTTQNSPQGSIDVSKRKWGYFAILNCLLWFPFKIHSLPHCL